VVDEQVMKLKAQLKEDKEKKAKEREERKKLSEFDPKQSITALSRFS
jgi:hypothetical protein